MLTYKEKMKLILNEKYPFAAKYDPEWIYENKMGCQCFYYFHSLDWWKWHFEKTRLFTVETGQHKGQQPVPNHCGN